MKAERFKCTAMATAGGRQGSPFSPLPSAEPPEPRFENHSAGTVHRRVVFCFLGDPAEFHVREHAADAESHTRTSACRMSRSRAMGMLSAFTRGIFGCLVVAVASIRAADQGALGPFVEKVFRPFVAEHSTISPDGRFVAFTQHSLGQITVVVVDLERPDERRTLVVADDKTVLFAKDKEPARLGYMRWADTSRLILSPTPELIPMPPIGLPGGVVIPYPGGPKIIAPVMVYDAISKKPRTLLEAEDLQVVGEPMWEGGPLVVHSRQFRILGQPAGDRSRLLLEVVARGPSPSEVVSVDLHTGKRKVLSEMNGAAVRMFDWQGRMRIEVPPTRSNERIYLIDSDGRGRRWKSISTLSFANADAFRVRPENYFGSRSYPLGIGFDGATLYFASNVGRDKFGVYARRLSNWEAGPLKVEDPHFDLAFPDDPAAASRYLVYDEFRKELVGIRTSVDRAGTVWLDPELGAAQRAFGDQFRGAVVSILGWDDKRTRFLVSVVEGSDPGQTFVYKRAERKLVQITRTAPWLASELHKSHFFEADVQQGIHLTGYITLPNKPRAKTAPIVMVFASGFPGQPHEEFDREAHVLAEMGFAVVRLNHRGVGGMGKAHRDNVSGGVGVNSIDDAAVIVDWLAARFPIDRKRVATMGRGFGGFLAVKALQHLPEKFACAIAIEPILDLAAWVTPPAGSDGPPSLVQEAVLSLVQTGLAGLRTQSVTGGARFAQPILILYNPNGPQSIVGGVAAMKFQRGRAGHMLQIEETNSDFALALPSARVSAYLKMHEFLNTNLYQYDVRVGPTKEIN